MLSEHFDKNFRMVLVCSASRYLRLVCITEPGFLRSDLLLVLHNKPGWLTTQYLKYRLPVMSSWCHQDLCLLRYPGLAVFISPASLLLCAGVVELSSNYMSPSWCPRRWRCSMGLSKLNIGCAVAISCYFSLMFHFKCVISVHTMYSCSPYVELKHLGLPEYSYNCAFCGLRILYPKHSWSLTL